MSSRSAIISFHLEIEIYFYKRIITWIWSSRGTGRTLGWKLNVELFPAPNHWDTSLQLLREEDKARIRIDFSSWEEIYLILEQTISRTGPPSPPNSCSSSTMKRLMFCTFFLCFHRLLSTSHFSGVEMIRFPLASSFRSVPVSPVKITTWRQNKNITINLR